MDGAFFIDVPCVADAVKHEFMAIMVLSPEQLVLAYDAASLKEGVEARPVGAGAVLAARELGAGKDSWEGCL
jgi:hypothetical protein